MFKEIKNMQIKISGAVGPLIAFLLGALLIIGPYFGILKSSETGEVLKPSIFSWIAGSFAILVGLAMRFAAGMSKK